MVSLHKESGAMIKAIEKNLNDLTDCVKNLKALHDETGLPVDDDNETFHRLCEKLEFLLCVGLEGSSRMFRHPRTTWHYINACLRSSGRTSDGIRIVRGLSELKTPLGKLRSFLRYCLVHQCLADTMQQCTLCGDITNDYYGSNALMANTNLRSNFIASLYELNDIQFDLAPTGYDLDVGWPTFARKQFGNFSWTKQLHSSRLSNSSFLSTSVQSLTSLQSGMTSPPSPGPLNSTMVSSVSVSPPGDSLETERLIRLVRQLTEEKDEMRDQLKAANKQLDEEKENSTKDRQRMEEEILQYKAQIEDLERRLESAEKQVSPKTLESLRQAETLAKKMLAIRDGEVELLKAQLNSTEAKVEALKERHALQKVLVMGEVRKMANDLAAAEFHLKKWTQLAKAWAIVDHADDIKWEPNDSEGVEELGIKLKEILTQKIESAKEMDALKEANMSLVKALAQHGRRLSTVTSQLDQTWVWFSKLKLQANQLQTDECVMRYELKEKREMLNSLKEQLEVSRQQWERIRTQNSANQEQWQSIRDELDGRKLSNGSSDTPEAAAVEVLQQEDPPGFVPPIDLVSDIDPLVTDRQLSPTLVVPEQVDVREERLRVMEQQCRALYAKLVKTTSKNAALVGRLATLHQHYTVKDQSVDQATATISSPPTDHPVTQDQVQESDHASLEKERQLAAVKQELQAFRFDQATRELQQEREKEAYKQQQEQLSSALDRLRDNEMLIRSLQEQLNALTGKNHEERQALDAQLRQLELSLMTRNEECEGLVNELRSTVAEMDQLRTAHLALQETVKTVRAAESQLKTDNQLLRDESLMLRDKIVQLIKEKDCLWQRSDRLLDLQRVQATHQWLSDDSISSCQACNTRFTLFVRRHHCRLCGRIFCHGCSDYWLRIASSARPTRTCPECYAIHQQFSQPGAGQLNGLGTMTDQQEVTVTADPVVAQHQPETSEPCAGFSVISDDEIVRSLNSSSPYSSPKDNHVEKTIRTATVKSFKSLLEQKSDERNMLEAFVSAGMVYRVPLQVDKPGYTLHWKFKTDPQSIAFAVVGFDGNETEANNEEEHDASSRVIVETALHKSERGFVEGHANLVLPGRYFVYFDNSFSRFAAKKVTFHLSLTSSIL